MPRGLKPVRRRLADGSIRLHWYHRATGKPLRHDPTTVEGLLEVKALDDRAKVLTAVEGALAGSYAALWARYRQSPEWRALRPRTRSDYQAVRDWLGPAAERKALSSLTAEKVYELRDKAGREKGRRFGNYVVQVLRLTLAWGKLRGHVGQNVAKEVKLARKPVGERKVNRAWLASEVEAFITGAPVQLAVPFALGLFAGMRQGDAIRVTWSAYDGSTLRWIAAKNGQACTAPVGGIFKTMLDEAKARRGARKGPQAVQIAVTLQGAAWSQSGFRASFFKRLRALRDANAVQPGCTFHGLRHTIGALARNDGQSDSRVAAAIGDRSPAMAQIYGRDADQESAQGEVLRAIQKRFANVDWKRSAS